MKYMNEDYPVGEEKLYGDNDSRDKVKKSLGKIFSRFLKTSREFLSGKNKEALEKKNYGLVSFIGKVENLLNQFQELEKELIRDYPRTPEGEYTSEQKQNCARLDTQLVSSLEKFLQKLEQLNINLSEKDFESFLQELKQLMSSSQESIKQRSELFREIERIHEECVQSLERFEAELQRRDLSDELFQKVKEIIQRFPDPVYPFVRVTEILGERLNTFYRTIQSRDSYDEGLQRYVTLYQSTIARFEEVEGEQYLKPYHRDIMTKFLNGKQEIQRAIHTLNELRDLNKRKVPERTQQNNQKGRGWIWIILTILVIGVIIFFLVNK